MPNRLLTLGIPGRGDRNTPRRIPGLALWLDASRIGGLDDGDPVPQWSDLSGNGHHATQATGSKQPVWKVGIANGRPVVRLDGVDDFFDLPTVLSGTDHTAFLVATALGANQQEILEHGGNTGKDGFRLIRSGSGATITYQTGTGAGRVTLTSVATVGTDPFLAEGRLGGTDMEGWLNGVSIGTDANSTPAAATDAFLGVQSDGGGLLDGDIAEVIIYGRALSDGERLRVERYLSHKWGVSVS